MMNDMRQTEIAEFLEKHFLSSEGVVYNMLDRRTRRLADEESFAGATPLAELHGTSGSDWYVEGFTRPEMAAHENSGMATGAALVAAVMEYRRTGSPAALARARRLFQGLRTIAACGATFEPGFITKYYGGRFTYETSTDQCLYHIYGMEAYHEIASPEEQAFIERQIPAIAAFWMHHHYTYTYFEHKDMVWPPLRFPPLLMVAWKYSGDEAFRQEANRIMQENIDCVPEFAVLPRYRNRRYSDYEETNQVRYFGNMPDRVSMDVMNLKLLLENDPQSPFAESWRKGVETIWDEARRVLTPDGRAYTLAIYRMKDGTAGAPPADCPLPWAKTAWSTMIVRAGLLGLPFMPHRKEEVCEAARLVLSSLKSEDLTYYEDLHGFSPQRQFQDRFLSGDSIANWLWAYELLKMT